MGKRATKTAVKQLQKIYEKLGNHGGVIRVEESDSVFSWWPLDFELFYDEESNSYSGMIGLYKEGNGDLLFDPLFNFTMCVNDHSIEEVILTGYESLGFISIDENDMNYTAVHSGKDGVISGKDELGLKKRFSQFMHNVTEFGPYLESRECFSYDSKGNLTENGKAV